MAAPRFHTLTISDVRRETPDAVSLAFAVPERLRTAYRYTPGQYLTLRATIDGEDVRRSYSICSGLDDGELRVVIKRLAGGAFSNWANEHLRVGDTLSVMTPDGRFGVPIEPGSPRTLVAFAAGSGITPVMAILKSVLRREAGRCFLFYGNRSTADIIFREQLEDLKDRYLARLSVFHVLSREQQDIAMLNGHLDAAKVGVLMRSVAPVASVDQAFICGPQPMIEGLETALAGLGMARERVHVERFTPGIGGRPRPVVVPPTARPKAIATVISEGARFDIPGGRGRGDHRRGDPCRTQPAVFLQGRHVLHLPREAGGGQGRDGGELLAGAVGDGGRLRADLPVAPGDRAGGDRLRSGVTHVTSGARIAAQVRR